MAIFVDTDNTVAANKLYSASKAGAAAARAEKIMQDVVVAVIGKAPGFTLEKSDDAKGYQIRLEIAHVKVVARDTITKVKGQIVRYPKDVAEGGKGKGESMVSLGDWSAEATASGTKDAAILDGVQACAEKMVPKSINAMKADFLRR
jgi:hypothetical protein